MDPINLILFVMAPINATLSILLYYDLYLKRIKQQPRKLTKKTGLVWLLLCAILCTPGLFVLLIGAGIGLGVFITPMLILSVILTAIAIYLTYKRFYKQANDSKNEKGIRKKIVSYALALTFLGYLGIALVHFDIIGDARGDLYLSEMTPVYNKDGTLKHDQHGNVVYDTYYDYETIPGTLEGDNGLYFFFGLCANIGSIGALFALKIDNKKK